MEQINHYMCQIVTTVFDIKHHNHKHYQSWISMHTYLYNKMILGLGLKIFYIAAV